MNCDPNFCFGGSESDIVFYLSVLCDNRSHTQVSAEADGNERAHLVPLEESPPGASYFDIFSPNSCVNKCYLCIAFFGSASSLLYYLVDDVLSCAQKYRLGKQSKKDTAFEVSRGGMYLANTNTEYYNLLK